MRECDHSSRKGVERGLREGKDEDQTLRLRLWPGLRVLEGPEDEEAESDDQKRTQGISLRTGFRSLADDAGFLSEEGDARNVREALDAFDCLGGDMPLDDQSERGVGAEVRIVGQGLSH